MIIFIIFIYYIIIFIIFIFIILYFLCFNVLLFTVQMKMLSDTEINIPFIQSFINFRSSIVLMHNNKTLQTKVSTICICNVRFTTSRKSCHRIYSLCRPQGCTVRAFYSHMRLKIDCASRKNKKGARVRAGFQPFH